MPVNARSAKVTDETESDQAPGQHEAIAVGWLPTDAIYGRGSCWLDARFQAYRAPTPPRVTCRCGWKKVPCAFRKPL